MENKVDFNEFTHNYNSLLRESTKYFSPNESYFAKYKVDLAQKHVSHPVQRLLEYGCGIGRNIPFLKEAFPNALVMGSDVSSESLVYAKEHHPDISFFHETDGDLITEKFDFIFVAGVFHHIPPSFRSSVMDALFHRLSAGGEIMIFEHNPYNPVTRKIVNDCPFDRDAVLLQPKELRMHLKQAGFSVMHQSYCLFVPPIFAKLTGIEKWLGWLPLGGQYWISAKRT